MTLKISNINRALLISAVALFCILPLSAQIDTSASLLGDEPEIEDKVIGAFKTTRVINMQSMEMTDPGVLDIKINHRFGSFKTGAYEAFGLDNAQVRIGADYGIIPNFAVSFGRSSVQQMLDVGLKYRIMQQTSNNKKPFSLLAYFSIARNGGKSINYPDLSSRLSHVSQIIIGKKFNDAFSMQISPSFVVMNPQQFQSGQEYAALGIGIRQKITARTSFNAEWIPYTQLSNSRSGKTGFHNSFSLGFDIETGGHVFQLHFTNSAGMVDQYFIPRTADNWLDGGFRFGFNISRVFTMVSPEKFR